MKSRSEDWANELWSLINNSDGTNCPHAKNCQIKNSGKNCISVDLEYAKSINKFFDSDTLISPRPLVSPPQKIHTCITTSRIFELVMRLAQHYSEKMGIKEIPVPIDIDGKVCGENVEIRLVPLKSAHGAVWRLKNDGWVIHLNSKDSSARRRHTLYHELFHIVAHCNASPVFRKNPFESAGAFNELLADHFSAVMIMPIDQLSKRWAEIKDVRKIAAIFDVPEPVMLIGLQQLDLI